MLITSDNHETTWKDAIFWFKVDNTLIQSVKLNEATIQRHSSNYPFELRDNSNYAFELWPLNSALIQSFSQYLN